MHGKQAYQRYLDMRGQLDIIQKEEIEPQVMLLRQRLIQKRDQIEDAVHKARGECRCSVSESIQSKSIELGGIEEYTWVDPPRLWEAVLPEGSIQKWSYFQQDSQFSPHPCTEVTGKKARWQPPIFVSSLLIGPKSCTPLFA